jgi:hypothetical protein
VQSNPICQYKLPRNPAQKTGREFGIPTPGRWPGEKQRGSIHRTTGYRNRIRRLYDGERLAKISDR